MGVPGKDGKVGGESDVTFMMVWSKFSGVPELLLGIAELRRIRG